MEPKNKTEKIIGKLIAAAIITCGAFFGGKFIYEKINEPDIIEPVEQQYTEQEKQDLVLDFHDKLENMDDIENGYDLQKFYIDKQGDEAYIYTFAHGGGRSIGVYKTVVGESNNDYYDIIDFISTTNCELVEDNSNHAYFWDKNAKMTSLLLDNMHLVENSILSSKLNSGLSVGISDAYWSRDRCDTNGLYTVKIGAFFVISAGPAMEFVKVEWSTQTEDPVDFFSFIRTNMASGEYIFTEEYTELSECFAESFDVSRENYYKTYAALQELERVELKA